MAHYLLQVADADAARLACWPAGLVQLVLVPGKDLLEDLRDPDGEVPDRHWVEANVRLGRRRPVPVAGLDAVTGEEYAAIARRLGRGG